MRSMNAVLALIVVLGNTGCGVPRAAAPSARESAATPPAPVPVQPAERRAAGKAAPEREPELPSPAAGTKKPGKKADGGDEKDADRILAIAKSCLGARYQFGAPPSLAPRVFDCSSFSQYLYHKVGITIPRTSTLQSQMNHDANGALRPADLVFFHDPDRDQPVGHVAIAVNPGRIIHAHPTGGVTYDSLDGWYGDHMLRDRSQRPLR
jgi:cell wall-associated NlpC family hydrolase